MEQLKRVQTLVGIAAVSAGSGLLLHLVLPSITQQRKFFLLSVVLLVVAAGVKLLPKVYRLRNERFSAQKFWSRSAPSGSPTARAPQPEPAQRQGTSMSDMNRYFAWIEKKLQELVVREGLECGLVRMKRGPLVITLQLRLINPTQRDLQKLMKLGPALAQLLQVETVRIADSAQGVLVEVPSPKPLTPNGALLARHTRSLAVAVGVDAAARPVLVNLEDHGALFWVGPSRRGKTQAIKSALYALLRENTGRLQFIIVASPAKVQNDWGVFATVASCLGIASSKEEIEAAMNWLVQAMTNGTTYAQAIHIILVVDDLPAILKAVPQITGALGDIAGMGAGLGVHLLVGTQGAGSKNTSGGTEIENNVTARILYRPLTTRTGSQSAGTGGLALHQLSSAKGDALALIDGHAIRIATAWISDRDIALLQSGAAAYPWRNATQTRSQRPEQPKTGWNKAEQGIEQAEITRNKDETGQNSPEQPRTTSASSSFQQFSTNGHGHATAQPAKHVLEQPLEQGVAQETKEFVSYLAQLSIEELKQDNLGLDATRYPTSEEQQVIRLAFGYADSIRKTCFMAYGHYNGKVRDYIKQVVEEVVTPTPSKESGGIPDTIDLNTAEGRALLKRLQSGGQIRWPDVDDLLDSER